MITSDHFSYRGLSNLYVPALTFFCVSQATESYNYILYIQNREGKCGNKMTDAINLAKFIIFVIVERFEVVTSSGPYNDFFWTLSSNNSQYSTEMKTQFPDTEN